MRKCIANEWEKMAPEGTERDPYDGGRGLSGVLRFYKGIGPALLQGPLSRFGDTAANDGAMALMDNLPMVIEIC